MINKIMQMKERGERVVLELVVSHDDYVNKNHVAVYEREAITKSSLVVTSVLGGGAALELEDSQYCIPEKDYRYFKIKESEYTFNDLIDVAVQAYKDGVIFELTIKDEGIQFKAKYGDVNWDVDMDRSSATTGIEDIKSLYTETFVIESKVDLNKLKTNAVITLKNNEKIVFSNKFEDGFFFDIDSFNSTTIPFIALKGATVTQEASK